MWKLVALWTAMVGCIFCKDFIWDNPSEGHLNGTNLDHSQNSGYFVMKDQGYINQDEIKLQLGEAHDPSTTFSNSPLPKNGSSFPSQLSSDLGSDENANDSSASKDDLDHSIIENANWSSEVDQKRGAKVMEKQKIRKPRYPFLGIGISAMERGLGKFEDFRNKLGYIDKTKFILDFHYELGEAACILRPRRSGKTLTIKMLKEFYWVPKIDVKSYNPDTKEHANMNYTAKDVFKGTFVDDRRNRKEFFEKYEKNKKDTFIEDNMNKWPVIEFSFEDVSFDLEGASQKEINKRLFINAIIDAFKEYKDVIFLRVAEEAWKIKYGTFSNETYQKLLRDSYFHPMDPIESQVDHLWHRFEKEMPAWVKDYFRIFYYEKTSFKDIETPLKTMVKIISEFYNKPVIILVDKHDYPIQELARDIIETPKDSKKLTQLMRRSLDTINSMLKAIGKGNQYVKKFLMFGISNMVVNHNNSGFDNLKINNIFEPKYSEYFGMTQTEVDRVIDKLFHVKKEIKDKIKANINTWYNGYYHKQDSILYSIYSVSQYISKCFEAYTKQYTESKDFQDYWVPEPEPFWADFGMLFFFNNYLNFGFEGKHKHFLRDLSFNNPAFYPDCDPEYVPQFENTTDQEEKVKILFHSMVHSGYLTQLNGDKKLFRIPNFELRWLLNRELNYYLLSFIPYEYIRSIFYSASEEHINGVGDFITESLRSVFLSQKQKKFNYGFPPPEVLIYRLLLKVKDIVPEDWEYKASRESGWLLMEPEYSPCSLRIKTNLSTLGSIVNFHLARYPDHKRIHYVIESRVDSCNAEGMKNKALQGLSQIFREDNQKYISPLPDTQSICNIGLAFENDKVCLVAVKIHMVDGKYVKVDPLKHMQFEVNLSYKTFIAIDWIIRENFDLQLPDTSKEPNLNSTDSDNSEVYNRKARDYILNQIEELKKSDTETNKQINQKG
jgi:hypothetical protein